ncbi:hypothetical protein AAC387_Pa02g2425 [Persea americana]
MSERSQPKPTAVFFSGNGCKSSSPPEIDSETAVVLSSSSAQQSKIGKRSSSPFTVAEPVLYFCCNNHTLFRSLSPIPAIDFLNPNQQRTDFSVLSTTGTGHCPSPTVSL